jgi:CheY-like chemotaxis protein
MENKRILVVDDSESFRTLMVHILDTHGYQVATAEDGGEALSKLEAFQPTLVLMDVQMPGADGYEVCRRIKDNPATRDIPVLMMSADTGVSHGAAAAAADDFIAKPFCLDDLLLKIKSLTALNAPLVSTAAFGVVGTLA